MHLTIHPNPLNRCFLSTCDPDPAPATPTPGPQEAVSTCTRSCVLPQCEPVGDRVLASRFQAPLLTLLLNNTRPLWVPWPEMPEAAFSGRQTRTRAPAQW